MHTTTREIVLSMAASNGILNRTTTAQKIVKRAEVVLLDKDVTISDVYNLETWLRSLTDEQRETITDGEQSEMDEINAMSPMNSKGTDHVSALIERMYEAIL